ncbi:hypothetical protein DMUE_1757 [Dictyocoela muelleri]|nr:hypothetical protein DMUE_1757 [Dictyocoela muelleri]
MLIEGSFVTLLKSMFRIINKLNRHINIMINSINLLVHGNIPIKKIKIPYKEIKLDFNIRDSFEIEYTDYILISFFESKEYIFSNLIDFIVYQKDNDFNFEIFKNENTNVTNSGNFDYKNKLFPDNLEKSEKHNNEIKLDNNDSFDLFILKLKKFLEEFLNICHIKFLTEPNLKILCKLNLLKQAYSFSCIYNFPKDIFLAFIFINYQQQLDKNNIDYDDICTKLYKYDKKSEGLNKKSVGLNKKSVDLNKKSDLNKKTEGLNKKTGGLNKKSVDLNKKSDLNKKLSLNYNKTFFSEQSSDVVSSSCSINIKSALTQNNHTKYKKIPQKIVKNPLKHNLKSKIKQKYNMTSCSIINIVESISSHDNINIYQEASNFKTYTPNKDLFTNLNRNSENLNYLKNSTDIKKDTSLFRLKNRLNYQKLNIFTKKGKQTNSDITKKYIYDPEIIRYIYNSIEYENFIFYLSKIIKYLDIEDILILYNSIDVLNYNQNIFLLYSISNEFENRKKYKLAIRFYYFLAQKLESDIEFIQFVNYKIEKLCLKNFSQSIFKKIISGGKDKNFKDKNFKDKNFKDKNFKDKNFKDKNFLKKSNKIDLISFFKTDCFRILKNHYFVSNKLIFPTEDTLPELLNLRITSTLSPIKNDTFQYVPENMSDTSKIFHSGKIYFEAEFSTGGILYYLRGTKIYNTPNFKNIDLLFKETDHEYSKKIDKKIKFSSKTKTSLENLKDDFTKINIEEEKLIIPLFLKFKKNISIYIDLKTSIKITSIFLNNKIVPIKSISLFYVNPKNKIKIIDIDDSEIIFKFVSPRDKVLIILKKGILHRIKNKIAIKKSERVIINKENVQLDTSNLYVIDKSCDFEMLFQINSCFYEKILFDFCH